MMSSTPKLWRVSDLTVMTVFTLVILAMYLKFLLYFVFESANVVLDDECPGIFTLVSFSSTASAS